jgi:hypothetical protein
VPKVLPGFAALLVPWQIVPDIEPLQLLGDPIVRLRLERLRIVEDADHDVTSPGNLSSSYESGVPQSPQKDRRTPGDDS